MPRELRQRKPRQGYPDVEIAYYENEAGPSKAHCVDEPDKPPSSPGNVPPSDDDDDEVAEEIPKRRHKTASSRARTSSSKPRVAVTGATGLPVGGSPISSKTQERKLPPRVQQATRPPSAPSTPPRVAKMYALPNPSAHHRHRAIPVFFRKEVVERLDEPPSLFKEPHIVPTNSMTAGRSITERVSKAWGFNVGAGPVWQIMEDRSCYKESIGSGTAPEKESLRRPRVYQNVSVRPGWQLLSNQCVANDWLRILYSTRFCTKFSGTL